MKILCVAIVAFSLITVCQLAPLTCEQLMKPVDQGPEVSQCIYSPVSCTGLFKLLSYKRTEMIYATLQCCQTLNRNLKDVFIISDIWDLVHGSSCVRQLSFVSFFGSVKFFKSFTGSNPNGQTKLLHGQHDH